MFHGTTIDELMQIVKRAEDRAHELEAQRNTKRFELLPGFLYETTISKQNWIGVA